jgi:hypothetical protein
MYNREKNNTSTTIYPKCHNTESERMPATNLLSSSFYLFYSSLSLSPSLASYSSGHSFTRTGKQEVLYCRRPLVCWLWRETTDAVFIKLNWERRMKKKRRKENEQHFPVLERFPPVCSFVLFLVSLPIALMSCTINAITCSIMDIKMVARLSLKSHL